MTSISLSATATGKADAVVVGVYATETAKGAKGVVLAPGAEAVDAAYGGALGKALDLLGATGKEGELTRVPAQGGLKAPLIVAVGLGGKPAKGESLSTDALRKSAAVAARSLAGKAKAVFALPAEDGAQAGAVAEGVLLGAYSYQGLKAARKDAKGAVGEVVLATSAAKAAPVKKAVERAGTVAGAVNLARDLINTPPSHLYPKTFAERAQAEVKDAALATLTIEVLDEKALAKGGYGGTVR